MSKIRKAFRAIKLLIQKPYLINLILDENENRKRYILKKYPGLTSLPALSLIDLFGQIDETVSPYTFLDGGSLPTDLALLRGLARKFNHCLYLEIGTWRGESVANVSPFASECITIDLPDDEKKAIGMTDAYINEHAILSRHLKNVTHLKVNSNTFDFVSLGKKFDLIFIDGDHHYEGVKNDTIRVFSGLVHEHSIVVWHDYAFNPEKVRYEVFAAILDGLKPELHPKLRYISNTMCAVYFPEPPEATGNVIKTFSLGISNKKEN